jgi:RHS repeat-associated protein
MTHFRILVTTATIMAASYRTLAESNAARVQAKPVFPSPIEWVGTEQPPESESGALLDAIGAFEAKGISAGFASLEDFLETHPRSAWAPSLEVSMAKHYRTSGRYTLALAHWESVWNTTKASSDPAAQRVAARAIAGWTRLLGSLGEKGKLTALFKELDALHLPLGSYGTTIEGTREGLRVMEASPADSYRCGSFAIGYLADALSLDPSVTHKLLQTLSPDGGFNMKQLVTLARTNGMGLEPVRRPAGAELVLPCVVHWKLNHYAAILEKNGDSYKVIDPTFGGHLWMKADAIDAEASGHFLVPAGKAPPSWQRLTVTQCASVYGKGYPNNPNDPDDDGPPPGCGGDDDQDDSCDPPSSNDGAGGGGQPPPPDPCCGMPRWSVTEPYISLWLQDTPLLYRLSNGKWMRLALSYKSRGEIKGSLVGGFGDKWGCNLFGMLQLSSSTPDTFTNFLANGGVQAFKTNGTPDYKSARSLSIGATTPRIPELLSPTGSRNRYGMIQGFLSGITNYFLTQHVDRYGRTVTINYQTLGTMVRATNVVDVDGRKITLAYTNTTFTNLITSASDPYGHTNYFIYDSQGRLKTIIDMAGLSSSMGYDGNNTATNLITPYGTNTFQYFASTNANDNNALSRALLVTEPTGDSQLCSYCDNCPDFMPCPGDGSLYAHYRLSFHWNRSQYASISAQGKTNYLAMPQSDYQLGEIKHWLHGSDTTTFTVSDTLDSQALPYDPVIGTRPGCINFTYQGQNGPFVGTSGALKRVVKVASGNWGTLAEIARNSLGRPTAVTNHNIGSGAGVTSFTSSYTNIFDSSGRNLQREIGPRGEMVRGYGYHPVITNLLTSVTNALGEVTRYTHDTNTMKVTSVTFPSGMVRTNIYYASGPSQGFLQIQADLGYRTNGFVYTNGNILYQTNELGLVITNVWDNLNRLVSTAYPDATTVSNVYDKLDIVAAKDRMTNWTHYGYNGVRQLTAVTNANGQITQYQYCGCGSPSQITRWNGTNALVTVLSYDIAGRPSTTTYPDGYQVNRSYDTDNHLYQIWDSGNRKLQFDYRFIGTDTFPAHTYAVPAVGTPPQIEYRQYDEYGRITNSTDQNSVATTNAYDFDGRLLARRMIGGSDMTGLETFAYTTNGLTNYTDPLGNGTTFIRDTEGKALYQVNANTQWLQFTYTADSQIRTLADGKTNVTTWAYDEYGRATNKVDALGTNSFIYQYDPNSRLTSRTSPAKGTTTYGYDAIGNLTNVVYPVSSNIAFIYDGLNRLTTMNDGVGTTTFTWTPGDQLASETGPWPDDAVNYFYNNRLRSSLSVRAPNASPWTQSYIYDDFARLSNSISPAGTFWYEYSGFDEPATLHYPSGAFSSRQFDGLNRLKSVSAYSYGSGTPIDQHLYTYNDGSQRKRQTFASGNYIDYTYDNIGQLKTAKGTEPDGVTPRLHEQFGYAYDGAWNLSYRTNNALLDTFAVNKANELTTVNRTGTLTVAGTTTSPATSATVNSQSATLYGDNTFAKTNVSLTDGINTITAAASDADGRSASTSVQANLPATNTFIYDANGNLLTNGARTFIYDDENQLITVTVSNTWRSDFVYDGLMRRRWRWESTWNGSAWVTNTIVRYVYDGRLPIQERDQNNFPLITYTRSLDRSGTLQGAGGIGGLVARTDHRLLAIGDFGAHAYYHADANGNITALLATNDLVVARYSYDPFGNLLSKSGPLAETNLYRFSSKEIHPASGMYYYGFRFYAPDSQRWTSRDPLEEPGGINLFQFAGNDAVCWFDSDGLHWTDYIPGWIDPAANFAAGMGDVLSFNATKGLRSLMGYGDAVDPCSGAYSAGRWTGIAESLAFGAGRLAYAGTAKIGALAAADEAGAVAFRNSLKSLFNLGMSDPNKMMTVGQAMAKYGGDASKVIAAAGRTNPYWNALGAASLGAGIYGAASNPCGR